MSRCLAGDTDAAKLGRVARTIRLAEPTAVVDELEPSIGPHDGYTLEVVLPETDAVPSSVLSALDDEDCRLRRAQPNGPSMVVVATA